MCACEHTCAYGESKGGRWPCGPLGPLEHHFILGKKKTICVRLSVAVRVLAARAMATEAAPVLALAAPRTDIDVLPYIDLQYNDASVRQQVESLIAAELKTFSPSPDALAHLPLREPSFEGCPMLQAEWLRVCAQEPMPPMDVSRYQLDPPPRAKQADLAAWNRSVENAQAQLEHQGTRLDNLELLQQHGANLWLAHLDGLEAASKRLSAEEAEIANSVEQLNRKRKADQLELGPKLARLEAGWVDRVKKNLTIEAQCIQLEQECKMLRRSLDPTAH